MSAVMKQAEHVPAMSESSLVEVLSSSLYPGAAHNSVVMVLAYCKAAQVRISATVEQIGDFFGYNEVKQ